MEIRTQEDMDRFLDDYDFLLPDELVARYPLPERDQSRLLLISLASRQMKEHSFSDLPALLQKSDVLVTNTTKVSKRRVFLRRSSGARIEALFITKQGDLWLCLLRKASKIRLEETLLTEQDGRCTFSYQGRTADGKLCLLKEFFPKDGVPFSRADESFFETCGELPIPPYLKRAAEPTDHTAYQTVFAETAGSVAAPTAGLHFTPALLKKLDDHEIEIAPLQLSVGYGTFAPLEVQNFQSKSLHTEPYNLSPATVGKLRGAGRIVATGTTSLRALESNWRSFGSFHEGDFETSLFLYPPDRIQSCQGLITNFHLPRSSLFLLVCAFAGGEIIRDAYDYAIRRQFRFYSYGDAMLILP